MAEMNLKNNPWMGLVGYEEGQSLYGRDEEIALLHNLISDNMAVVVYGKSGIGKSSLLKAGVFPKLRHDRFAPFYIRLKHNTDESYSTQIVRAINNAEGGYVNDLLQKKVPDLGLWDFIHRNEITDSDGALVTPVIVLDQFEEIYTLTDADHKAAVQDFFSQLADVLNETKPDIVIEEERKLALTSEKATGENNTSGFMLKPVAKTALKYKSEAQFRIVICLRDDSLYLLERSSVTIPSLKANRFNLNALGEEAAKEVIVRPYPGYINEDQCKEIVTRYSEFNNDGDKVVDPAILSLFLYLYYENNGRIHYDEIFTQYYEQCIKSIKESTTSYLEDNLITEGGFRYQVRADEVFGRNDERKKDIEKLHMDFHILKAERYNGIRKYEFSHDRICLAAKKHKDERILRRQNKRMRIRIALLLAFLLAIVSSILGGRYFERSTHEDQTIIIAALEDSLLQYQERYCQAEKNLENSQYNQLDMLEQIQKRAETNGNDTLQRFIKMLKIQLEMSFSDSL